MVWQPLIGRDCAKTAQNGSRWTPGTGLIIYMPQDGRKVRKMRIDHKVGDTPAKQNLLRPDKRHSEDHGPVSDKRQKDEAAKTRQQWDDNSWWQSSNWSTSSSSWRWNR